MGAPTRRRGDSQNTIAVTGPVPNHQDAESVVQSIPGLLPYSNNDWRPAFDKRLPGLLYSSEAVRSLRSRSNVIKMGEAYHQCTRGFLDPQDLHNTTSIGKGYYMKAMTPRADLEMDLDDSPENPEEEDGLRHVSPDPGQLDEMARAVLRSGSPLPDDSVSGYEAGDSDASTLTPETDTTLRASERGEYDDLSEAEQQQEGEDGAGRLSTNPPGSLADLRQSVSGPAGSKETTSGLDETKPELEDNKPGLADGDDEGEEAKLAEPCLKKPPLSSLPDPIPISDGTRGGPPTKERSSGLETAQRHLEHIASRFKSIVLDPARHGRAPTAAEKGKGRAECECSECQPQQRKWVGFSSSAMDGAEAEDGPGLSQRGFVKMMMENMRTVEEDPRGEGCSSWATAGPAELAWLCMFTNPRPAPQMPVLVPGCKRERSFTVARRGSARKMRVDKRDIGEPMEQQDRDVEAGVRYSLFPLAVALPSSNSGPTAGGQTKTTPLALQRTTHGTIRRKAWGRLSKRFKEVRDNPRWIPRVAAE